MADPTRSEKPEGQSVSAESDTRARDYFCAVLEADTTPRETR